MTVQVDALVFDTGPLRHFATHGWLGVLRFIAGSRPVYVPDSVAQELDQAAAYQRATQTVLDAEWITVHRSADLDYVSAFAYYDSRLVVGSKNRGECGVLAMGEVYGCEMVLDDETARVIADERGLRVTATVPLLCTAIREKQLTTTMVEKLVDDLLEGDYYLPITRGGFRQHVVENGLLDYEELG